MTRPSLIVLTALFLGFGCVNVQAQDRPTITAPAEGEEVSSQVQVRGTTGPLPAGTYLWVLARRSDFFPLWWPQREVRVKDGSKGWSSAVHLGAPKDIGWDFDIGVIAVDSVGHEKLSDYWEKAMASGAWKPIRIPDPIAEYPPHVITVKRTSH